MILRACQQTFLCKLGHLKFLSRSLLFMETKCSEMVVTSNYLRQQQRSLKQLFDNCRRWKCPEQGRRGKNESKIKHQVG